MIDVHTYVFNAAYLPLEGILRARRVGPVVSWVLATLLESQTEHEDLRERTAFTETLRSQEAGSGADQASLEAVVLSAFAPSTSKSSDLHEHQGVEGRVEGPEPAEHLERTELPTERTTRPE